jgi:ubiquinone/menaquinone biosynthesis C-methylase UbiE
VDINEKSIECANKYWKHKRNAFLQSDIFNIAYPEKPFEWLISFETIEHVDNPEKFLSEAAKHCKHIICSVPNEDVFPFNAKKHVFHKRHYRPKEFKDLLKSCGWKTKKIFYQKDKFSREFNDQTGRTIIIRANSEHFKND